MPNVCLNLFTHDQDPERRLYNPRNPLHRALQTRPTIQFSSNLTAKIIRAAVHRGRRPPPSNGNARSQITIRVGRRNEGGESRGRTRPGRVQIRATSLSSRTTIRRIRSTRLHCAHLAIFHSRSIEYWYRTSIIVISSPRIDFSTGHFLRISSSRVIVMTSAHFG